MTGPKTRFSHTHSGLAEALLLVAAGRVGEVGGVLALDGDVVLQGDVADLDVIEGPAHKTAKAFGRGHGVFEQRQERARHASLASTGARPARKPREEVREHLRAATQVIRLYLCTYDTIKRDERE